MMIKCGDYDAEIEKNEVTIHVPASCVPFTSEYRTDETIILTVDELWEFAKKVKAKEIARKITKGK